MDSVGTKILIPEYSSINIRATLKLQYRQINAFKPPNNYLVDAIQP
jgi:hypothetical protein